MKCFCGRNDAIIRADELDTAQITGRAHVDCAGHSHYRDVTIKDVMKSLYWHSHPDVRFRKRRNNAWGF